MERKHIHLTLIALTTVLSLTAQQQISAPYQHGFEDAAENANWTLNVGTLGTQCNDQWFIGSSTFNEGRNSLYITDDGGLTPQFGGKPDIVVASRTFSIADGSYEVSFDWKNMAVGNSGLYVCLTKQSSALQPESDPSSSAMPNWLRNGQQQVTLSDGSRTYCLASRQEWTTASFDMNVTRGQVLTLSFVWMNSNRDTTLKDLGACIDNIQIVSTACRKPYDVTLQQLSCDSVMLSWKGSSEEYTIEYKANGNEDWTRIDDIGTMQYLITGLEESTYDFRIQGVCLDTLFSAWATLNSQLIFCPDDHCFNYVDLNDTANITCYIGEAGKPKSFVKKIANFGPDSKSSRHTVYYALNQFDPRTGNKLRTIPEGEFASIRLGNWDVNSEAERIEFKYKVDCAVASILIMRYAVVLEDPNHSTTDQPFFSLKLLDENGNELDPDCGKANFYAQRGREGWNVYTGERGDLYYSWKDWTTMGINLQPYDGQTIIVQLETRDCMYGGHFGYAYFTLGCASGEIDNVSCGASPQMDIEAPDGFDYRWYSSEDPDKTLSDSIIYTVQSSDTTTYYVDCMFKENHDCRFTLSTVVSPRNPFADFSYTWEPKECRNYIRLINRSHVTSSDKDGTLIHTDEPVQRVTWQMDDGTSYTQNDPVIHMPDTGGVLSFTLRAELSDGECVDDTSFSITVPSIISAPTRIDTTVCFGSVIQFGDKLINTKNISSYEEYEYTVPNIAGCDSSAFMRLSVLPEIADTYLTDSICFGDTLWIGDIPLSSSVQRQEVWLTTADGCDSIVTVDLTVHDEVTFSVSHTDETSGPNSGSITLSDTPEDYTWSVNGTMDAPLTGLKGGEYKIVVYNRYGCPSDTVTVFIDRECLEIEIDIPDSLSACADDSALLLPYTVSKGLTSTYTVQFDSTASGAGFADATDTLSGDAIRIALPDSCRPNRYGATLTVHDDICGDQSFPLAFDILYSPDIVAQKWDNVLAVKNSGYNGGYDFLSFLWYRNGQPLPGETSSVLYLGENSSFDITDSYQVLLTRSNDRVSMLSCPAVLTLKQELTDYPTVTSVPAGCPMRIAATQDATTVRIYSVSGILYTEETVDSHHSYVTAPPVPGVYIVHTECGLECRTYNILVR